MSGIAEASLAAGIVGASATVMGLLKKSKKRVSMDKYLNDKDKRGIEEHDHRIDRLERRLESTPQTSSANSNRYANHGMLNDQHCIVNTEKLLLKNPYGYAIEATDVSYRKWTGIWERQHIR